MARYSKLKPISQNEKIELCAKMINFFGINEPLKEKARTFLKITKEPGIDRPFSLNDFMTYFSHEDGEDYNKIRAQIIELARKLESRGFLSHAGNKGYSMGGERCFHIGFELTKLQRKGWLYLSEVLGIDFVFETFKKNIAHITGVDSKGDIVGGTGILISNSIVLTCAHVITDMNKRDDTLTIEDKKYKILRCKHHKLIDIAFIEIENPNDIIIKDLIFEQGSVLEKIIAIGFPPVPRSTHPILVVQTGEVTGYMTDTSKNNYMLFSAIARPGNSGGPIISEKGRVIGIVSLEVKFDGTSTFPFFASVPTNEIQKALSEIGCPVEIPIDTYE